MATDSNSWGPAIRAHYLSLSPGSRWKRTLCFWSRVSSTVDLSLCLWTHLKGVTFLILKDAIKINCRFVTTPRGDRERTKIPPLTLCYTKERMDMCGRIWRRLELVSLRLPFTNSNTKQVFVWWQTVQQSSSYSEVNHSAKWSAVSAVLSANTSRRRSQRPRLKSQNEIAGSD